MVGFKSDFDFCGLDEFGVGDIEGEMFKSIVEKSNDIILITGADYTIKYITHSVIKVLGMMPKTAIGKSLFEFIDPAKETSLRRFVEHNTGSSEDKFTEICIHSKNNRTVYFDVTISNLLSNEEVSGLVINLHDITDRKLAEQKLLKANNELDQFIYKISHDLRAPLLSALGLVELAEIDPDKGKHDYLKMIKCSLGQLDNFIEDINSILSK
ncbi:MAG TPA: PAS domain S-box protein [Fulvivirga sp.]|nr:PAS domain S-box protein [Fulvivirga sp.]